MLGSPSMHLTNGLTTTTTLMKTPNLNIVQMKQKRPTKRPTKQLIQENLISVTANEDAL